MIHERYHHIALLLLRLTFGLSMAFAHGWPKLQQLLAGGDIKFYDFMGIGPAASLGLAVFAELLCGLLLALGWFSRFAALPLIFTMLVAIFGPHLGDPYGKIEKAILYIIPYLCLLLTGPGWYSIDAQWRKKA
jgi:putative oxidoreductase